MDIVRKFKLWYIGSDIGVLSRLESMPLDCGFTYRNFADPEAAIGRASESQPDAILFGLGLERGIEFINDGIMRAALQKCSIVTVFLARNPAAESPAALEAGYDLAWETLPPDMTILCAAVRREMSKKNGAGYPECDIAVCRGMYNETVAALAEGAVELLKLKEGLETQNTELRLVRDELEQFVHTISHDLKEPLMSVRTYSRMLAEGNSGLSAEQSDHIRHITESVELMKRQIDSLLAFSRAGRVNHDARVDNIGGMIDDIFRERGFDRRSDVSIIVREELPSVKAASQQVKQIFSNLISNGIKHNKSERKEIVVAFEHSIPAELSSIFADGIIPLGYGLFSVSDNGTGIPGGDRDLPFELFRRMENAANTEGYGAGLAIVKRAVTSLGGAIDYVTEQGKGTTMYFTLPVAFTGDISISPVKSRAESRSVSQLKAALLS